MRHALQNPKVKFYIGNVRDKSSVDIAMRGVDYVFAAAALKQVPSCEFFPMEATMTNVIGTNNVLLSAIEHGVKNVVVLSTDKAAYPINAMGITKAIEEKIEPVKQDIQQLRDYVAKVDTDEKHKMDLIVSSYRYRLTQLCRLYLKRGHMTIGEYEQLNEFYHLYTGLGGNGEAKIWYDRAIQLPIVTPVHEEHKYEA